MAPPARGRRQQHPARTFEPTLRPVGDELEVAAKTAADHEQLGLSSGLLGKSRTPTEIIIQGRLIP